MLSWVYPTSCKQTSGSQGGGQCKVRCTLVLKYLVMQRWKLALVGLEACCPQAQSGLFSPLSLKGWQFITASLGKLCFCWANLWDLNLMYDICQLQGFNAYIFQTLEKYRVKSAQLNPLPNDSCSQFGSVPQFTVVVIFRGKSVEIDWPYSTPGRPRDSVFAKLYVVRRVKLYSQVNGNASCCHTLFGWLWLLRQSFRDVPLKLATSVS